MQPVAYGAPPAMINPTTPLLATDGSPTSPPIAHQPLGSPKGYEYDLSNVMPPSAVDGAFLGSPTSSMDLGKIGGTLPSGMTASVPHPQASYGALAAAAGVGVSAAGARARRPSATPSFATTGSNYSVDQPPVVVSPAGEQSLTTPQHSSLGHANPKRSSRGASGGGSSGGHSAVGPVTPGYDAYDAADEERIPYIVRTPSATGMMGMGAGVGGMWRSETPPAIDQRLDPDSVLIAKGRSPGGKRLSVGALTVGHGSGGSGGGHGSQSEESLGGGSFFRDDEDYSRRVLRVKNPT